MGEEDQGQLHDAKDLDATLSPALSTQLLGFDPQRAFLLEQKREDAPYKRGSFGCSGRDARRRGVKTG